MLEKIKTLLQYVKPNTKNPNENIHFALNFSNSLFYSDFSILIEFVQKKILIKIPSKFKRYYELKRKTSIVILNN